jgi:RimJ/RimL family protein N-acetyltransferase
MVSLPFAAGLVVVDRLRPTDATVIHQYRNDPGIARFQSWPVPFPLDAVRALVEEMAQVPLFVPGRGVQLGIRRAVDDVFVGDVYVNVLADSPWEAELGVTVARFDQGRGHARDAITAVLDGVLGSAVNKVIAYVDTRNEASLRLFDRVGFRREGYLAESFRRGDRFVDEVLFGVTARQWRGRPGLDIEVTDRPHPADVVFLAERLYEFNVAATGVDDGRELAVFLRDHHGRLEGGAAGVVWGGAARLDLLWVTERRRGAGHGRRLLGAFEDAARRGGARRVLLSTHTFQAPRFYERLGYRPTGSWDGFPAGHGMVFMQKGL